MADTHIQISLTPIQLSCRAICFLKLNRFEEAKQDCDSALQLEPSNKKAFYRRALAHKGLQVPQTCTVISSKWLDLCIYLLITISVCVCVCTSVLGLPVGQQRPTGGPPARPQRSGSWAGAGGGDGPLETEPDGRHRKHSKGKTWCI